uniref:Uncharacterized protein n=1 Tax=Anguilla anguilla TaxID=7936 RepID=A0A0E9U558_ANGAN
MYQDYFSFHSSEKIKMSKMQSPPVVSENSLPCKNPRPEHEKKEKSASYFNSVQCPC